MNAADSQALRTLLVVRHAKAARPLGVADHDRPLDPAGVTQAQLLGRHLAEADLVPDLALVSSALRTRQTWSTLAAVWDGTAGDAVRVIETRRLYEASAGDVLAEIRAWGESHARVLVCGHEPTMSALVTRVTNETGSEAVDQLRTGAAVILRVATGWEVLADATVTRVWQPGD